MLVWMTRKKFYTIYIVHWGDEFYFTMLNGDIFRWIMILHMNRIFILYLHNLNADERLVYSQLTVTWNTKWLSFRHAYYFITFILLSIWILKSRFLSHERPRCLCTSTVWTILSLNLDGKGLSWFYFLEK